MSKVNGLLKGRPDSRNAIDVSRRFSEDDHKNLLHSSSPTGEYKSCRGNRELVSLIIIKVVSS